MGHGTISATPLVVDGRVAAQGGTLNLAAVSGPGTLALDTGGTAYAHAVCSVAAIDFVAGGNEKLIALPNDITGTIVGFGKGDTIDIRNSTVTTLSFLAGTLTALDGTTVVDKLLFSGVYDTQDFGLKSDGTTGVDITFLAGSAEPPSAPALCWFTPHWSGAPIFDIGADILRTGGW